jgi:hypothetical protein
MLESFELSGNSVWVTEKLDQFHFDQSNRPIESIIADIIALHLYPILVNDDGLVEDGQEVARALSYHVISNMGIIHVGLTARNTDKWATVNFVASCTSAGLLTASLTSDCQNLPETTATSL